jgi:hypothetical protein
MAGNPPKSIVAQLATDAERFSAFWEARRQRAPGLRDQLARQKAPETTGFLDVNSGGSVRRPHIT